MQQPVSTRTEFRGWKWSCWLNCVVLSYGSSWLPVCSLLTGLLLACFALGKPSQGGGKPLSFVVGGSRQPHELLGGAETPRWVLDWFGGEAVVLWALPTAAPCCSCPAGHGPSPASGARRVPPLRISGVPTEGGFLCVSRGSLLLLWKCFGPPSKSSCKQL